MPLMNKRPGHVNVTTEVAYCTFCGRPRTLRREEHQLGTLVRTIVTCETCHRTLSSSIGVAPSEPSAAEGPGQKVESPAAVTPAPEPAPSKREPTAAAAKAAAKKPAPKKAASKATPAKPAPKKPAAKATTSTRTAAAKGSTAKKTASKKK
jgi:hypothetical protein